MQRHNPHLHLLRPRQAGRILSVILAVTLLLILASPQVGFTAPARGSLQETAAAAPVISYQGRLVNPGTGAPMAGTYTFVFRLYNSDTGGTALWTETKDIAVANGLFSTLLGDTTPFPATVFTGQDLWLGVKVGADPEATPRQRIGAVAYSLYANNADRLDGQESTSFAPASHNHDDLYFTEVEAEDRFVSVMGDAMAGSSAGPLLDVTQSGAGEGGRFVSGASHGVEGATNASANGIAGVRGVAGLPSATVSGVSGVLGLSATGQGVAGVSEDGNGVYAWSTTTWAMLAEGEEGGVAASAWSPGSDAVRGVNTATSGTSYGLYGRNYSTSGGAGVRGQSPYVGVWGVATSSSGVNWGVYGTTASPGGYGGYFSAPSGGTAGRFTGNVAVVGTLTKSNGTFKIDHPLDPENKYLSHSFVESPDMMNVYNGNVTLDDEGAAWVDLPAYFEALNRDFRYQLTPLGGPGPNLHIAQEVQGNRFRIAGGSPGLRVSWQVTGIRQDAYAQANPIIVEEEKPAEERGTLLHPEAYGREAAAGVDARPDFAPLDADRQEEPVAGPAVTVTEISQ